MIKYEKGHRLSSNGYLCEFDQALVLVETDNDGKIIKASIYYKNKGVVESESFKSGS